MYAINGASLPEKKPSQEIRKKRKISPDGKKRRVRGRRVCGCGAEGHFCPKLISLFSSTTNDVFPPSPSPTPSLLSPLGSHTRTSGRLLPLFSPLPSSLQESPEKSFPILGIPQYCRLETTNCVLITWTLCLFKCLVPKHS